MKSLFIIVLFLSIFTSCNKKGDQFYTNVEGLKKYINVPKTINKVKYQIVEDDIRTGGQDCKTHLSIYAVLELPKKDFDSIVNFSTKKYTFPIQTSSDSYKKWYPNLIKKKVIQKNKDFVTILPPIYDGVLFTNKNSDGESLFFISDNNEICLIYELCQ